MVPYERDWHISLISNDLNEQKYGNVAQGGDGGYSAMLAELKKQNG